MAKQPAVAATTPEHSRKSPLWIRWLIRIRAYFRKEVNEIRRQPLLILSLIVGPLLVLIIFGASYQNSNPILRTAIVMPEGGIPGLSEDLIRNLAGTNFQIERITTDRAGAEAALAAGELDVIQILPATIFEAIQQNQTSNILIVSNAINPLNEGWIQYLAYAEVNEINKAILRSTTQQAQEQAATIKVRVVDTEGKISELEAETSQEAQAEVQSDIREIISTIETLEENLPSVAVLAAQNDELAKLPETLSRLKTNLQEVDTAISDGTVAQHLEDLAAARQDLLQLDSILEIFVNTSPDILISPVTQSYNNIRGNAYSAVIYYAPGVLALLVQHTAITLGALALVRERLMGAFEVFRVAPVHMVQLLIGKYLGYTLFIAFSSVILIGAMLLLGVPLLGAWWQFALLLLLLTVASLGVGFLISTVSGSDSQAIQLAMITLLLSIFFSGFFIALDSFAKPALAVSYIIPMTHGVSGFQNLMLRGIAPDPLAWIALGILAIISFGLVVFLTNRQFKQA